MTESVAIRRLSGTFAVLVGILGLAFALRLYKLTAVALWFDESVSLALSSYPWSDLFRRAAEDIGPPLYFVILKLWRVVFGDSLLSLRSLSLAFQVLAVWFGYLFVKVAFHDVRLAQLAALLIALNPLQIQYAREIRMYAMGACAVMLSSWLLARALRNGHKSAWIAYAFAVATCLYTHYYLAFAVFGQCLVAIWACIVARPEKRSQAFTALALAYGVAAALFAPWIPTLVQQVRRVEQDFWMPPLTLEAVMRVMWALMLGGNDSQWAPIVGVVVVTGMLAVSLAFVVRGARDWASWLVITQAACPIAMGLVLSLNRPIFMDRYLLFASAFWSILIAMAVRRVPIRALRLSLVAAIVLVSLGAFAKNLNAIGLVSLRNPVHKPGMSAAAAAVNSRARPDDSIVIPHSLIYFSFKYYNRTGIDPVLYARIPLNEFAYYAGRSILDPSDLTYDLQQIRGPKRVWYIWTDGFYQRKEAVPDTWQLRSTRSFEDTPYFKGSIYVDEYIVHPQPPTSTP